MPVWPSTLEGTFLGSDFCAGLPRGWHPVFPICLPAGSLLAVAGGGNV